MADNILSRVYTALTGSTALMALVKQVSYEYPENFKDLPAVTYKKDLANYNYAFNGSGGAVSYTDKTIAIDIWSKSPDLNEQIAEKVTAALNFMQIENETDISEQLYKHKNIKFIINE